MPSDDVLPPFGALRPPETSNQRSRKVLKGLWISLPFIVVMMVVGLALLSLQLWSWLAMNQVASEDYPAAGRSYERQTHLPSPASWVADYNMGSVLLLQGEPAAALPWLESAFDNVPKASADENGQMQAFTYECAVRMNTSAGYEMLGDTASEAGDTDSADENYATALEWATPCVMSGAAAPEEDDSETSQEQTPQGAEQQEQEASDAGERIEQKRRELSEDTTPESEETPPPGEESQPEQPFSGESDSERERREQLEERRQEQADRQREREESTNRDYSPRGW